MSSPTQPTSRRIYQIALIVVFLAAIGLPLVAQVLNWRTVSQRRFAEAERRPPAPFPKWKWTLPMLKKWPRQFDEWYRDHFGLRQDAIRICSSVRRAVGAPADGGRAGTTVTVDGDNGWMFLGDDFESVMRLSTGRLQQPEAKVLDVVTRLERRRQLLAEQGIHVVLVIAPDKQTIYSDHLPAWLQPVRSRTATDQFLEGFGRHSGFQIIDLRPPVRAARRQYGELLYYKQDSHWTGLGAYIGYQQIRDACKDRVPLKDLRLASWQVKPRQEPGDLARLVGLHTLSDHEPDLTLVDDAGQPVPLSEAARKKFGQERREVWQVSQAGSGTSVIVVGDSFSSALMPFLTLGAGRVAWAHNVHNDPAVVMKWIETFKPKLLVLQIVERRISRVAGVWGVSDSKIVQRTSPSTDPQVAR